MIDISQEGYVAATGDARPEKPRRVFVRRNPTKFTINALIWIKDSHEWKERYLDWIVSTLRKTAQEKL